MEDTVDMKDSVKDIIRRRKSVRTFNGEALRSEDRRKLDEFLGTSGNPFGVPVEFRFLDAKEHGLSSPVIIGTDEYVAAKVSRKAFEKAMEVGEDEFMPVASPVGYPADRRSVRETLMRKGIKADERLPFGTLFFEESFAQPLVPERAGRFRAALEMARLAPSAGNKQPWRAVICGEKAHFYEKKAKAFSDNPLGDIQKVDVGIALAHFDLTLKESGIEGRFAVQDPGFGADDSMEYIVTYEVVN